MGTAARNLLWRISPLFWLTAVSLVVVHDADPAFQQIGWVVVTTGLGAAGVLSGAIRATAEHDTALLIEQLATATRPQAASLEPRLHRARAR